MWLRNPQGGWSMMIPNPKCKAWGLSQKKIGAQKSHLQSSYVPYFDGHTLTYIRNIMNWKKFRCVGHTQRGFVAGPHYHLWQLGSGSTRRSRRKHLPPVESGCPCFNGDCWGEIYSSSWRTFNIQRFVLLMCKPARIYSWTAEIFCSFRYRYPGSRNRFCIVVESSARGPSTLCWLFQCWRWTVDRSVKTLQKTKGQDIRTGKKKGKTLGPWGVSYDHTSYTTVYLISLHVLPACHKPTGSGFTSQRGKGNKWDPESLKKFDHF